MLRVSERNGVRVLAVDRPPVNAIDIVVIDALNQALESAELAPDCRAVILTGTGAAFSAGIDRKAVPAYPPPMRARMLREVNRMFRRLYGFPKPTVAAINGLAIGGGLVVAMACDLRLATDAEYRIGLTAITAGVPYPAGPLTVLRAELDPRTLRRLALGGDAFGPTDPRAANFIDELVATEHLLETAERHALALAVPAYGKVKRQLREPALAALDRVVDDDQEPLLREWL